jgi:peptidyl-tRNA hydrolase
MAPVDFIIFGIGSPLDEYQGTRNNAGHTFCDYIANCVSMQSLLLEQGLTAEMAEEATIPSDFQRPIFLRVTEMGGKELSI